MNKKIKVIEADHVQETRNPKEKKENSLQNKFKNNKILNRITNKMKMSMLLRKL